MQRYTYFDSWKKVSRLHQLCRLNCYYHSQENKPVTKQKKIVWQVSLPSYFSIATRATLLWAVLYMCPCCRVTTRLDACGDRPKVIPQLPVPMYCPIILWALHIQGATGCWFTGQWSMSSWVSRSLHWCTLGHKTSFVWSQHFSFHWRRKQSRWCLGWEHSPLMSSESTAWPKAASRAK